MCGCGEHTRAPATPVVVAAAVVVVVQWLLYPHARASLFQDMPQPQFSGFGANHFTESDFVAIDAGVTTLRLGL